jgi:TfoX/Sxy family transcriptional regulator of competence genes
MEAILKEMPNLKEDKKLKIKMDTTTSLVNGECDWDKKAKTLNKFYTNPNFNHKLKNKNKEIVVKVGQKDKKEKEIGSKSGHDFCDYILSYSTKGQFEKFEEGDIKKMFGNKGIHIYDIQKNMFDKGTYNTIRFKVRENEEEGNLKQKIEEVKKELAEKDFKIQINPEKKKDIRKNTKKFVSNPGAKIGILNENIGVYNNAKHTKIPDKIRKKNSFSKQFVQINYGYKKNK